jgi:sialate O-acetylesterase
VQPQGGKARALAGWTFRPANVTVALVDDKNQHPTLLYNRMIHPLQPYALRGVIWYQGESNANTVADAMKYRRQFPALIQQWRRQWQAPELPFLWVQLANFSSGVDKGDQSPWAVLRESQSATLSLPATAQVVTIDIGDPADIHPLNKQDVGKRLALAARHVAYGEALVYSGPVHAQAQFSAGAATLAFDGGGSALAVRGGGTRVHGFTLAGADRVFHPAEASLVDGRVVVRSGAVKTPVAVRYGWSDNPADADLINAAGLPASPFRTDAW